MSPAPRAAAAALTAGPPITTLVCDYGGVLTNPLAETYAIFSDSTGIPVEDLRGAFDRATRRYGVSPMAELETGAIAEAELVRRVLSELETDPGDVLGGLPFGEIWFRGRRANEELTAFLRTVRAAGHRVALLTNNVREWEPRWRATLPVEELFDTVVDSSREGVRKPDPEIYRRLVARLGADPATVLLLDDLEENCAAARGQRMHAIRFDTTDQAVRDVGRLMGLPGRPHGPSGGMS
ncbi:HAD family hydrolase [Streptomyces yaizuensis]|uniref:HAD family phosphatase n=1 Tax=Streptomyces yaizuensis TaxID=2989713 RepID=A0ABQ5P291_9ACTN|nr:HAD family phosphatase [Streptomyces sp. YSPA8]GLF96722.1 HAD family phosphatase [Streptomyces sp. YSPA8]